MKNLSILTVSLAMFIILTSCEDNSTNPNKKNIGNFKEEVLNLNPLDSVYVRYVNNINWENVTGILIIRKYTNSTVIEGEIQTGSNYSAYANTLDYDQYTLRSENFIGLNHVGLQEIGEGCFYLASDDCPPNYNINFGKGTNNIVLENFYGVEVLNSEFSIQSPIEMSNVTTMQNIPISKDFIVNLTPSSDACLFRAHLSKNISNTDTLGIGSTVGIYTFYQTNSGSIKIPSYMMSAALKPGIYDLEVTKEEVKMLDRADGKKLAVYTKTYDTKTIRLVP